RAPPPQADAAQEDGDVAEMKEVPEAVEDGVGRNPHGQPGQRRPTQSRERVRHRRPSTARAAAKPLRTAPSMVAGRPVSVQSPARNRPLMGVAVPGRKVSASGSEAKAASGSRITTERGTAAADMAGK